MIQINLLKEGRRQRRIPQLKQIPPEVLVGVVVAIAALSVFFWYWHLRSVRADAIASKTELQQQSQELLALRAQLGQFEEQKKLLEERAGVIEDLKQTQKGPVLILNSIIAAIPSEPGIWLTRLEQEEVNVVIAGQAFNVPAIADFVARLSESAPFRSVDLEYWEEEKESVKFELNCILSRN